MSTVHDALMKSKLNAANFSNILDLEERHRALRLKLQGSVSFFQVEDVAKIGGVQLRLHQGIMHSTHVEVCRTQPLQASKPKMCYASSLGPRRPPPVAGHKRANPVGP